VSGPRQEAVGFVLAGGHSARMGRDKALLPWGNTTLLDHAVARLRAVTTEVRLLPGPDPRYLERGLPLVTDGVRGAGPLAGVLAGLEASGGAAGLFLAVDLPFVPEALLARLVERLAGADAVVPVTADGPHPLCAAYAAGCVPAMRLRLAAGQRKMTAFWPDVRVHELREEELARFGEPASLLRNANTPEEYATLLRAR
jgi:molybdopterin-guanine dinucleotide biosynthesis protein A